LQVTWEFGEEIENDKEQLWMLENDYLPRLEDELYDIEDQEEMEVCCSRHSDLV
jgi:hypothetical protein